MLHPPKSIDENSVGSPKPVKKRSNDELDASPYNAKGFNAIVNGVDVFQHQLVSTCKISKAAWDILQNTFEGDNLVKHSKLHKFTFDFENLNTHENESIF